MPVLSDSEWEALRLSSVRGVSDGILSKEFGVSVNTIIKRRSRDSIWQAAVQSRRGTGPVSSPVIKPPEKQIVEVVTKSLDQIATENNLLAAQFAHGAMQDSIKSGLVSAPTSWQELSTAYKMVRTATGQDKEGTSVSLSLWGAGAVAIAGAPDPFDSAVDVTPTHEKPSHEEWI